MKEFKADDDMTIKSAAMSAIALAAAYDCEITLIYRERHIKVSKDHTVNKVVKTWHKVKDEPEE